MSDPILVTAAFPSGTSPSATRSVRLLDVWISWHQAIWIAVVCGVYSAATSWLPAGPSSRAPIRAARWARAALREIGIVAVLYALWQWVFALTVTETVGAKAHATRIYELEQSLGLPSELDLQHLSMRSRLIIEFLNRYYAYVHVPAMGVLILWLFLRHRDRYPRIRNVLALTTGACLAIQSIPVAPPRFLPNLGFVDTGLLFGQSVYGTGGSGLSNQLAAMPSVHVAWSTLIAVAVISVSTSKWRWFVVAHPLITFWAVVATGNHWWADGIVAIVLLAASFGILAGFDAIVRRSRPGAPEPDHRRGDRAPEGGRFSLRASGSRSPSSRGG